ncbi:uncharacterized protein LOC143904753 [Temnothorax americanus]|uniref:uncharacterized protein LOC143904753 n=1 Tax=Temnothorax americanus TaxID=1964332 RepID=UPI004068256A
MVLSPHGALPQFALTEEASGNAMGYKSNSEVPYLLKYLVSPMAPVDLTVNHVDHQANHSHPVNVNPYHPLQLSIFSTDTSITQNSCNRSPQTGKGYKCPCCDKDLSHKYTLVRHLKTVCGKVRYTNGKWECKGCNRTYESQGSLSRHCRYECRVNPQFRCVFCKRLFTQKCSLSRHERKHQKDINVYVELGSYPSRSTFVSE